MLRHYKIENEQILEQVYQMFSLKTEVATLTFFNKFTA